MTVYKIIYLDLFCCNHHIKLYKPYLFYKFIDPHSTQKKKNGRKGVFILILKKVFCNKRFLSRINILEYS